MLSGLWRKKIDGIGLSIFRITFFLVLFFEIKDLFYFRKMIYGPQSFLVESEIDLSYALILWMGVCLCLVLGVGTRTNLCLNYALSLVFIATIDTYEYHMFYVYMGVGFLCLFMPLSRCLSVDRLIARLRYSANGFEYRAPHTVSTWHYYMLILHGIGFIYFGSIFYKLDSPMWTSGLGLWLPASLPMISHRDLSLVLDSEVLSLMLGYVTVFFEAIFIFLVWSKKARPILCLIGLVLHLGILVCFPIPWFALGEGAVLLLLVPVSFWRHLLPRAANPMVIVYSPQNTLQLRLKILLEALDPFSTLTFQAASTHRPLFVTIKGVEHTGISLLPVILKRVGYLYPFGVIFDIPCIRRLSLAVVSFWGQRKRMAGRAVESSECEKTSAALPIPSYTSQNLEKWQRCAMTLIFLIFLAMQLATIYQTEPVRKLIKTIGLSEPKIDRIISRKLSLLCKELFGITSHGVFMDSHFSNYNHIIRIDYINESGDTVELPIIDRKGQPLRYNSGFNWVKWTFRANAPNIVQKRLEKAVRDFTYFWAYRNDINLRVQEERFFRIQVKKIEVPKKWEKGFRRSLEARPWRDAGFVTWRHGRFHSQLAIVEDL